MIAYNNQQQLVYLLAEYQQLGIDDSIDRDKFRLYSIITNSTAIEGSTMTEMENMLLFDEGIHAKGKTMVEQMMNLDLKAAYEQSMVLARKHEPFGMDMLKRLSAIVMRNTGGKYSTTMGEFDSSKGDLRRVNVTAGFGGRSYMNCMKVEKALGEFCANMNERRSEVAEQDALTKYVLSIDAHYLLVTIHPWVDGNGRMARLVMNMLQFEYGLLPIKVTKEDKSEYIQALEQSREEESIEPFRHFMLAEHCRNLQAEIDLFKKGLDREVLKQENH